MVFSRPMVIESRLTPSATRARVSAFATSTEMPNLEAFRRRQIVSWRLSKANEDFLFQPEYGDSLDIEGRGSSDWSSRRARARASEAASSRCGS